MPNDSKTVEIFTPAGYTRLGFNSPIVRPAMSGFLGSPARTVAESSEFFTFFHLIVFPELSDLKKKILVFKPSGEAFQKFATVKISVGVTEEVHTIELILARRFLNDPHKGIFAADIAKSFIRGAFSKVAQSEVELLAEDIEFRARSASPILTALPNRGAVTFARPPTAAYEVYCGKANSVEISAQQEKLNLENLVVEGEEALSMIASVVA